MKTKISLILCFVVVALMQLSVPAQMIRENEAVLETGNAFKFALAPIDPNDPFRGKYIILDFNADSVIVTEKSSFAADQPVFLTLNEDKNGFARIKKVWTVKPNTTDAYVKAKVAYTSISGKSQIIYLEYPFDRFYLEESKAPAAEKLYNQAAANKNQLTYAVVKVKSGQAVVQDIILNGSPISKQLSGN